MRNFLNKLKCLVSTKRRLIQLYTALLFNANIKGFFNGKIYKGPLKNFCTPGLNCYSCPGASGACPLGALQNALGASEKRAPYYVVGIIILYGILFGRFICGWLCPFGLIQELLYKIKTPKLKKNKLTRVLSYTKYIILIFFVFVIPLAYGFRNFPLPAFCKYICPAGTLEGAIGLLSNQVNAGELARLGPLFTWKFALMVSIIVMCVFIFRAFCRFFCPLGALYGIFNRISILGIKLDRPKCVDCGLCHAKCKMDIREVGDRECISCGDCVSVCPTKAISFKGSKIILADNEIAQKTDENTDLMPENVEKSKKKEKVRRIVKYTIAAVMSLLLAGTLIYYNFIDKPIEATVGSSVGDICPEYDVPLFDENGDLGTTFNPASNKGKITIVNFWGTWCGPCKQELPDFDKIATEYKDSVTVIAIHSVAELDDPAEYVKKNYANSDMLFGRDKLHPEDENVDYYFTMLGGSDSYPITIVLDEDGVIIHTVYDAMHYDDLKQIIEDELNK